MIKAKLLLAATGVVLLGGLALQPAAAAPGYQVWVSNEKSGDVTIIEGGSLKVIGTLPVGKRPRGIHASPDGHTVYVALSGTPIEAPPELDAAGNPVFKKGHGKDDDDDRDHRNHQPGIHDDDIDTLGFVQQNAPGGDRCPDAKAEEAQGCLAEDHARNG